MWYDSVVGLTNVQHSLFTATSTDRWTNQPTGSNSSSKMKYKRIADVRTNSRAVHDIDTELKTQWRKKEEENEKQENKSYFVSAFVCYYYYYYCCSFSFDDSDTFSWRRFSVHVVLCAIRLRNSKTFSDSSLIVRNSLKIFVYKHQKLTVLEFCWNIYEC